MLPKDDRYLKFQTRPSPAEGLLLAVSVLLVTASILFFYI
jgi:hypothetical protein